MRVNHYKEIRQAIIDVKHDWTNHKAQQYLISEYNPLILNISQKVLETNSTLSDVHEVVQDCQSFFRELLWQYNLHSPVHFTVYLQRKLYFRLKNYYEAQTSFHTYTLDGAIDVESKRNPNIMSRDNWESVKDLLDEREVDLLICNELLGLKQREVAQLLNTVQPNISIMKKAIYQKILAAQGAY